MNGHTFHDLAAQTGRALAVVAVVALVVAGTVGAAGATTVRLATDETVGVSQTTTVDVVIDGVDGGVGAYNVTVALDDSIARITDVDLHGDPPERTRRVEVASDDSSVTMVAALVDTPDAGSVTVATITLRGVEAGATDIDLTVATLGDERGQPYRVTGVDGASIAVTDGSAQGSAGGDAGPGDDGSRGDQSIPPDASSLDARVERAVAVFAGVLAVLGGPLALPIVVTLALGGAVGLGVVIGRRT